jgi:CheY-like chemotaxis protein
MDASLFASSSNMNALSYTPNGRILVVDDNARALQAMSELLEFEGFSVLTARNGLDALNKMRTADHISLVLLDLDASDERVGGFTAKEKRRRHSRDPRGCAFSGSPGLA